MLFINRRIWQKHEIAVLIAGLIVSLVLILLPGPFRHNLGNKVVATLFAPLSYPVYQLKSLFNSWNENTALRQRLAEVSLENISFREAVQENDGLRKLLELKSRAGWQLKAAQIAGREPSVLTPFLVVELASQPGIEKDMVAISDMGLVGKISEVGPKYSTIRTIFDSETRVSAIVIRSRVLGIFRMDKEKNCILDRVPLRADVLPGDTVLTSGYGQIFPYGLLLGTVEKIKIDKRQLTLNIEIKPSLNINRASQVMVITGGVNPSVPSLKKIQAADSSVARLRRKTKIPTKPELIIRMPEAPATILNETNPAEEDSQ